MKNGTMTKIKSKMTFSRGKMGLLDKNLSTKCSTKSPKEDLKSKWSFWSRSGRLPRVPPYKEESMRYKCYGWRESQEAQGSRPCAALEREAQGRITGISKRQLPLHSQTKSFSSPLKQSLMNGKRGTSLLFLFQIIFLPPPHQFACNFHLI